MFKFTRRALVGSFLMAASVSVAALSFAEDAKPAAPAAADEAGFVSLFNGKDTTGWIYGGTKEHPMKSGEGYRVEDGVLYCTKSDGGNLYTEKEYTDFVYRFDFKLEPNANNGIGIRAPLEGDAAYKGMEIQVLDDSGDEYKSLRPAQYHGSVYDLFPCERGHQKPVGEWNTEEIKVKGHQVTVTLNGHVITDADLSTVTDEAILKKHPGVKNEKGHIGFLGHGAKVEFKNMRVKEL
jgi:hypothetical protein